MSLQEVDIADQTFGLSRSHIIYRWVYFALFAGLGGYAAHLSLTELRPVLLLFVAFFLTVGVAMAA